MLRDERVGVLGVGRMGFPIVKRLIKVGFRVIAYDPVEKRAVDSGAIAVGTAAALASASDILITILPGAKEAEHALLETDEVLGALPVGSLWLDLTSNDPRVAKSIADRASTRGIDSVGAPMAGGVSAAERNELAFFVGGSGCAMARARPVLDALGSSEHVGDTVEAGYTAKLLANLLWFGQVVAVTEALLLGQSLGLEPAKLRNTLAASAGGSVFIDEYLDHLLEGDYLETFGIDRCVEELDALVSLAQGANVPFELSVTVARLHREALERYGAVDGELLAARLLEERAGRTLRRGII